MGNLKPRHKAPEIIEAIKDTGGIKSTIARRLGVGRETFDKYLVRFPSVKAAYEQETERIGDIAESAIIQAIGKQHLDVCMWYARVKLASRGYAPRQEVTGKDGNAIEYADVTEARAKLASRISSIAARKRPDGATSDPDTEAG